MLQHNENIINYTAGTVMSNDFPVIKKLGAISPCGESSPFYFKGKMWRLELKDQSHGLDTETKVCAVIRDFYTGEIISELGEGCYYYSFFGDGSKAYVLGTESEGNSFAGCEISIFESDDLINWSKRSLIKREGWKYFNTSLTKGADGYVLLMESNTGDEEIGVPFTFFFAKSTDMVNWEFMPTETAFSRNMYNGGPWMHYTGGYYYVVSLTELPFQRYSNYLYRTKDFLTWEVGLYNPLLSPSREDRFISPNACELENGWQECVKDMFLSSSSDFDACYEPERNVTHISYILGNQSGAYYSAEAEYEGTLEEFLERNFS